MTLTKILTNKNLTPEEKLVLQWDEHRAALGSFHTQLFDLIAIADKDNRKALAKGFPAHVDAYNSWFKGDLDFKMLMQGLT